MLKLLRFLPLGTWHDHRWEILRTVNVVVSEGGLPVYTKYVLRCSDCGKMKVFKDEKRFLANEAMLERGRWDSAASRPSWSESERRETRLADVQKMRAPMGAPLKL